jgi:DHA2 family multidrug resistance protein
MDAATIDPRKRVMLTIVVMMATVMQSLDTTIANVALPHMQGSLSATQDQISWVLTSYIVASAIMTAPVGFLVGRIGRKNLMLWSIAGFTLSSMLCGISQSLSEMVVFRLIQGGFGAALVPLSQAIILDIYPKEKHGQGMALWGIGALVGPVLGPTLGGYLTEYMNWRWVFFINLPFGILALMGIVALLTEEERNRERPFDIRGFFLLSIGVGALQLGLDRGQLQDWLKSTEILIEFGVAVLSIYFFIIHIFSTEHPFVDRRVFADRNFVLGTCFIFLLSMIVLATVALMPPYLENIRGFPVLITGLVMAPRGIGTMLTMFIVGRLSDKLGQRLVLLVGIMLIVLSLWMTSLFNADVGFSRIIWTGLIQGVGLGFIFAPMTAVAYATLPAHLRAEAVGIFGLLRNIGSSIGVSVVFAVLVRQTQISHADLVEHVNPYNPLLQPLNLFDNAGGQISAAALAVVDGEITRQASMIAFIDDTRLMMFICFLMVPLVFLMRNPVKHLPPPEIIGE